MRRFAAFFIATLSLSFVGFSEPVHSGTLPAFDFELRVEMPQLTKRLDPALAAAPTELFVIRQIYTGLFTMTGGGPKPELVYRFDADEQAGRYHFWLRPGVKTQSGRPLTTDDVLWSFSRLLSPKSCSPSWWLLAPVEGALAFRAGRALTITGFQKLSDIEFVIQLVGPLPQGYPSLLVLLADPRLAIIPVQPDMGAPHLVDKPQGWSEFTTGGSGDRSLKLEAVEDQHLGKPYAEAVLFLPEAEQADIRFKAGLPDGGENDPHRVAQSYGSLLIHPDSVLLKSDLTRAGLTLAIDRTSLVEIFLPNGGSPIDRIQARDPQTRQFVEGRPVYDAAKAREAFAQDALEQPLKLLVDGERKDLVTIARRIGSDLKDTGLPVLIVERAGAGFARTLREEPWDLWLFEMSFPDPHPLWPAMWMRLDQVRLSAEQINTFENMWREGFPLRSHPAPERVIPLYRLPYTLKNERANVRSGEGPILDLADIWKDAP